MPTTRRRCRRRPPPPTSSRVVNRLFLYFFATICIIRIGGNNVVMVATALSNSRPTQTTTDNTKGNHRNDNFKQRQQQQQQLFLNEYNGNKFKWQASLDSITGRASSIEVSSCNVEITVNENDASSSSSWESKLQQHAYDLVKSWPTFLAKKSITFGLIRTLPNFPTEESTSIHLRFFKNIPLLSFGQVGVVKVAGAVKRPQEQQEHNNQQEQACTATTSSNCSFPYELHLPITGGLLSRLMVTPSSSSAVSNNDNDNDTSSNGNNNQHDRGMLKYIVEIVNDDDNTSSSTQSSSSDSVEAKPGATIRCRLRTEISGNYCPWIAGKPPITKLRKFVYLKSQSIIHAYTMWRFHRVWKKMVGTMQ